MESVSETDQVISIVNACSTGGDLLEVFNLTSLLDELYGFRDNLTDSLNIDITNELSLDELDSFTAEIGLLNTDEFEIAGDEYLVNLNAVGAQTQFVNCVCPDSAVGDSCPVYGSADAEFTRAKLRNNECYNAAGATETERVPECWTTTATSTPSTAAEADALTLQLAQCVGNFSTAFLAVNAEVDLINQTQAAIDDIKRVTSTIVTAYDNLFGVAVDIENSVENISCAVDPIWERLDVLRENYTQCGFLGEAYGGFKEIGCVTLFSDMYWISCAMMIVAFLSILVVCLGFMTQYSWHPVHEEDEEEMHGAMSEPGTNGGMEQPSAPAESPGHVPTDFAPDTTQDGDVL